MRHDYVITLDELPAFGTGNIAPHVGILSPADDGSAWYPDGVVDLTAYAIDRDGDITQVSFYANGQLITTDDTSPYGCRWSRARAGFYDVTAVALDNAGDRTTSNTVRIAVGMVDLAKGKVATASSGKTVEAAVDGNYHTMWSADKGDDQWIYVDLGQVQRIDRVNLLWGWKIHAQAYTIDVCSNNPDDLTKWLTVYETKNQKYQTWEATYRVRFDPVSARYVRMHAKKRAGRQNWGGYQLAALEIPVTVVSKPR